LVEKANDEIGLSPLTRVVDFIWIMAAVEKRIIECRKQFVSMNEILELEIDIAFPRGDGVGKPCSAQDESGACTIWKNEKDFKLICRYWPFHPDNLVKFPQCGFSFERCEDE